MYAGMSQTTATLTLKHPERTKRSSLFAALIATAILAGCAAKNPAPVTDMSAAGSGSAVADSYVVRPGDTLYRIAQAHNMDVSTLISLNGISDPSQLRVGQTLRLNSSGKAAPAPAPTAGATAVPVSPVAPSEPAPAARARDAAAVQWGWPASGTVIQGFNANTKGIDISGAVGDPVSAAASGKVMYAGNGVRGLGNLILLGHSSGFITAYAHNQTLLVKTGQQVQKGAKIATIGQTDTTSPRLHFEIRRSGTPVNPMSYLPASR
jgi:lipoprotein NlpD